MSKATHLTSGPLRLVANCVDGKAVLAINAASAATVKTTGAIAYCVNGIAYSKAALAAQALTALATADFTGYDSVSGTFPVPTGAGAAGVNGRGTYLQPAGIPGFYLQPVSTTVYHVLAVNDAGTVRVIQGTYDNQNLVNGGGYTLAGKSVVPDVPDGWTAFGIIKTVTNSSTTFQVGTDALDKAGVTFTFYDVKVLPAGAAI